MTIRTLPQFLRAYAKHKTIKAVSRATDTPYTTTHGFYARAISERLIEKRPQGAPSREALTKQIKISNKAGGRVKVAKATQIDAAPDKDGVRRYIFTSAQNNTKLHTQFWENLTAYAGYLGARICVSRFTYSKRHQYGMDKGESNTVKGAEDMWWDKALLPHLLDERAEVAPGLIWCGDMNIIPTAADPLSGLESYTGRHSGIFPHVKCRMASIAAGKYEPTKFNYTTGAITQRNYIQRKEGLKAQFHHVYGALLVEVDAGGNWYVRQLNADSTGTFYDTPATAKTGIVRVRKGEVTEGHRAEAATMGDIHEDQIDESVKQTIWGEGGMLDTLDPKYQFLHDLLDGYRFNHHEANNVHSVFRRYVEKKTSIADELRGVHRFLVETKRDGTKTIVVDSNHHHFLGRWLRERNGLLDPSNAEIWIKAQSLVYSALRRDATEPNYLRIAMEAIGEAGFEKQSGIKFLNPDESFITCADAHGGIENGMHGHDGPNGSRGSPRNLARMGRKANTGHTHTAGIVDGVYTAGCCCILDPEYVHGPSAWSHSQIVTYPNGKRAIITLWAGKWRA